MTSSETRRGYFDMPLGQVHYRTASADPALPVMIMLHQSPLSSRNYERALPLLAAFCRPVALDTPGHGASDPAPAGWEVGDYGALVWTVADRLGAERVHIFGRATGSVFAFATRGSLSTDDANADLFATSSTRSCTSGSNSGGLLGGTGGTVGGVLNTAAQTTGGALNTATSTVSNATGSLSSTASGTVRGLSISQSSSASAGVGSVLSASNGNVRIEKGATFNLAIAQSVSATKQ